MTKAANVTRIKTLLRTDRSVMRGKVARELSPAKALAVDQAYDEYCHRVEQGEDVDVAAFCESHGDCESELLRCIELHRFLDDNPDALDALEPIPWPSVGDAFADKTILAELGRGGIGRVYLAQESKLPRKVVLKVSAFENGEAVRLSRLEHENIVPIYCIDDDPATGLSAICMPFLGQHTLHDVLDVAYQDDQRPAAWVDVESELSPSETPEDAAAQSLSYARGVLKLGCDIANALQHCHDQRIYHLDLKPSNILLTSDGTPMLIDFGISTDDEHREVFGGTKPYMSPEQIRSFLFPVSPTVPAPDGKSDVYSLAVILVQLLTGKHPFADIAFQGTAQQLLLCQQQLDSQTLLTNSGLPASIVRLLTSCLAPDPADRPAAIELSQALREGLGQPSSSRQRKLLAAALAMLLAGGAVWWMGAGNSAATVPRLSQQDSAELQYQLALYDPEREDAIHLLSSAIEKAPSNDKYLSARAYAYCSRGTRNDFMLARDDYWEAYRASVQPNTLACVAYCEAKTGRYDDAFTHASRAADTGFRNAEVRNIKAYARSKTRSKNALDFAIESFKNLTSDCPDFQPGWYNLASIYFEKALREPTSSVVNGIDAIEHALAAGPEQPGMLFYLAGFLDIQISREPEVVADIPAQQTRIRDLLIRAVNTGLDPKYIENGPLFKSVLDPTLRSRIAAETHENPLRLRPFLIHPLKSDSSLAIAD